MNSWLKDFRYAYRGLIRYPGFSLMVIGVLAIGIGANASIFSVVNSVLLRPLPYANSERLAMIWGNFKSLNIERLLAKPAEFEDYRAQTNTFEQVGAFETLNLDLTDRGQAKRIKGAAVSNNIFSMLGAVPERGRTFSEADGGINECAVISHTFWQREFGGNDSALTQSLMLNDKKYTVVGVMPVSFEFPHPSLPFGGPVDIWIPLSYSRDQVVTREGPYRLNVLALLKSDVSFDEANSQMATLGRDFERQFRGYRGPNNADGGWRISLSSLRDEAVGDHKRSLLLLLGVVIIVLLIACANVANLLMVRAARRQKEIAVRLALGASRWRIVRQLLVENLLLAGLGGASGFCLAVWCVKTLVSLRAVPVPRLSEITIDGRVLAFTILVTLITALVFGLVPALSASRLDLQPTLKARGITPSWSKHYWRTFILISEIALSLVLLAGAGLLVKSLWQLNRATPQLVSANLLTAEVELSETRYQTPEQIDNFSQALMQRVNSWPGVEGATSGSFTPLSGTARNDPFSIEGRPLDPANITTAGWQVVGPAYFQVLGIPLIAGRDFTKEDCSRNAPLTAIVNESMARRYWPGESPLGKRVTVGLPRSNDSWATIVGVAKDLPHRTVDTTPEPDWYLARSSRSQRGLVFFIRGAGDVASLTPSVRAMVAEIDPNQTVANVATLSSIVAETVAPRKFNLLLFAIFAGVALLLAVLGVYGVIAFSVAERTPEWGIRLALGAKRSDILMQVMKQGLRFTIFGIVLGVALAFALARLMRTLLFGVAPHDAFTLTVVSITVFLVALLACYVPARRATKVDPLVALRYE